MGCSTAAKSDAKSGLRKVVSKDGMLADLKGPTEAVSTAAKTDTDWVAWWVAWKGVIWADSSVAVTAALSVASKAEVSVGYLVVYWVGLKVAWKDEWWAGDLV